MLLVYKQIFEVLFVDSVKQVVYVLKGVDVVFVVLVIMLECLKVVVYGDVVCNVVMQFVKLFGMNLCQFVEQIVVVFIVQLVV